METDGTAVGLAHCYIGLHGGIEQKRIAWGDEKIVGDNEAVFVGFVETGEGKRIR